MHVCHQPAFCAGWLYFHMSIYIIDTTVVEESNGPLFYKTFNGNKCHLS